MSSVPASSLPESGFSGARRRPSSPAGLFFVLGVVLAGLPAAEANAQDVTLPALVSYAVSPAVVDVTAGPATATLAARFSDDLSGFESASVLYSAPGFTALAQVDFDAGHRISGDALDGIYETSFEVPEFEKQGVWTVYALIVRDVAGNSGALPLGSLPPGTSYEVISHEDAGPPTLLSFTAAPGAVDVTLGPGPITVTTGVSDDTSGVDKVRVTLESPTQAETALLEMDAANRISGDALDGVYRGVFEIPQLAETGLWSVKNVRVVDRFGYVANLSAGDLPGTAPTVDVSASPDSQPPQVVSIALSSTTIDFTQPPWQTVVTLHVTDDVTGFGDAGILFESPIQGVAETLAIDSGDRISGGPLDGYYQATLHVPPGSPLGVWAISLFANDPAGNPVVLNGAAVPGPGALSVIRSAPIPALGPGATGALLVAVAALGARVLGRGAR